MMRVAGTALLAPVIAAGGFLTLTVGSLNVFAASTATTTHVAAPAIPQSSSRPHPHERVVCRPSHVSEKHGECTVTFYDKTTKGAPNPSGQKVCFSVTPTNPDEVLTGHKHCAFVVVSHGATGTFRASGKFCGSATITATEPNDTAAKTLHTTVRIICDSKPATTTAAMVPVGSPLPPSGGNGLLGVMGVGAALVTGYAVRNRRWFSPGRLAANQYA